MPLMRLVCLFCKTLKGIQDCCKILLKRVAKKEKIELLRSLTIDSKVEKKKYIPQTGHLLYGKGSIILCHLGVVFQ